MATLHDSLVSSSARKMTIRKRPDLSAKKQHYLGQSYWVVKEPVGLNYYRFQEEEYAILQKLDGHISLDELKEWFEDEFPPQKITLEELQQFIGMLHRSGLVIASVPGQGTQLRKRRDERRRKEMLGAASNILCIRFKGIDPERILNWLYPKLRWLFNLPVLIISLSFALSALTLVTVNFDVFYSKLPSFYQFFNPYNALWLAVVLGLTKVVHEFGHGLMCKHFGGECHEMGVMILVLTPCLYCNVSDSWMLPNKWHRAAIGAAGMYLEVIIAAAATYIWWFTQPGLLNMVCLNIIFVSSVSTIMFNANPLLRYDGYYILADIVEIPNLRQKATSILNRKMADWFLGIEPPEDPFLPQRNQVFFAIYSVASVVYRWFVVISISWFLTRVFEPYGLAVIGYGIICMSLFGMVGMPLFKLYKYFAVPGRMHKVKKPRFYATAAAVVLIVLAVIYVPLPHRVMSTLEVRAHDADRVYVDVPGELEEILVKPGQQVDEGQTLAKLESIDVDMEIARLEGEKKMYQSQLSHLRMGSLRTMGVGLEIRQIEESLKAVEHQLEQKKFDQERLVLHSPVAGTVLPPPWREKKPGPKGQLPSWSGTPLQERNLGAPLDEGEIFCLVGDPNKMEAILYIDQGDIDFVKKGQEVEIKLDELPFDVYEGTIEEIAPSESKFVPKQIAAKAGGDLATTTDEAGVEKPLSASYQARVLIDDPDDLIRLGLRGRAKIHTASQTLGQRIWRGLNQLVNFKL
ncbi:MAG: HlyD family efflux transporter periplasmic adaptor subunit [Pirellulales bacterium]|nr:HlyD family efflux transporter periplasmic adaptor subunit [Pirellulales bacterium]